MKMSPSVYGSTRLLLSTTNQDLRMFNKPEVRKVKRILFGPVDRSATQKFIDDERKKLLIDQSNKYNFNFRLEHPLPEGQFAWRLATPPKQPPKTPTKRKMDGEIDISNQYCDLPELHEADIVRPRPIKSVSQEHRIQQSRITDFMKATKRPLSDISKKAPSSSSNWNQSEIPTKIARLDILT
ncbi:unnamed protein product [Ceutorhynchus assimilis]|uniref:Cyclin-dependent kinase inhibitor domain-containing protein n=1 Tax=Ceutorhynchus assimilis TaxID=467358 RepID=A0A9N9MHH5_9CUCU|nr:unnamed protein product [Ceutorhynchus assimilis]